MSTMMNLKYFKGIGRADPIRILLHAASKQSQTVSSTNAALLEWTNTQISAADWPEEKKLAPLGQLPTLSMADGNKGTKEGPPPPPFCQTTALIRFVAKKVGYYPTDDMEALIVDEALETVNELVDRIPFFGFKDEEDKKAKRTAFQDGILTNVAIFLESRIQSFGEGKRFVASGWSAADVYLWTVVHFISKGDIDYIDPKFFDKYTGIVELSKGIEADMVVKDYLEHIASSSLP